MSDVIEDWVRRRVADAADAQPTPRVASLIATATAARVRDAAAKVAVEAALAARGCGLSWDEVYESLFNSRVPDAALSGGEVAFYYCSTGHPWPPAHADPPLMVLWTCMACLHRVADQGPWSGPDGESGHAGECPRHFADVEVWQAYTDGDDPAEEDVQ